VRRINVESPEIAQTKTSNNIIQKGLAFLCKQSGSVPVPVVRRVPGSLPRRLNGQGGASVVAAGGAAKPKEISMRKPIRNPENGLAIVSNYAPPET
jgi:hypothetical protein